MGRKSKGTTTSVFDQSKMLTKLCDFHREKAWTEWVNKKEHGIHEKKKVLALLRGIALACSREEHNAALVNLTSSNVWKKNEMLKTWFSHKWLPDIKICTDEFTKFGLLQKMS
ncbi:uncharacterized protein ACNLHF_019753 isoform 2-T2 [Anomaloglossus baeobatrachus]